MKSLIRYLFIALLSVATLNMQETYAKKPKVEVVLSDKLEAKINSKVNELTNKMSKDLSLSAKQAKKVHSIKLTEVRAIEMERNNDLKSQQEIKNEIILISTASDKKVYKVLKKNQDILFEAKKSDYRYNPGLMENLKDIYKDTKENIKEKLGIK